MYESYWQIDEKPFEAGCDPRYFFAGTTHQAALLKLRYAIENHRGGGMLSGGCGLGKTLLVQMLRSALTESYTPLIHLVYPQMASGELLAYLADELCGETTPHSGTPGVHESVRRIQSFLARNSEQGRHAVAIVDEAHLVDAPDVLEALRLLLNFEFGGRPALTLVLVGQAGLLSTIERTPQMEERLDVKCMLRPFNAAETAAYVEHRLRTAGAARSVFADDALDALHDLTQGIPRRINRLCDLALLIGYAEELEVISAAHLHSVQRELVLVTAD